MEKIKSHGNIVDRLSELPDSLILEILSLLGMRDVVRTSLLSKRWKDLWVTIPCLKFQYFMKDFVKFRIFVYQTLTCWRGSHLRAFSIDFTTDSDSDSEASVLSLDIALWVKLATERKVEDLCIQFYFGYPKFCPPQCLYECSSIRKLSLYGCNLQIRRNVKWDRLNTLKLSNCVVSEDAMNRVFSSSPQLEEFTIRCYLIELRNLSIRSSSLKRLSIVYLGCEPHPPTLTISAPNLQVLKYIGTPDVKCLLTNISSLIELHLDFPYDGAAVKEALCQILPLIQHVVTVQLSSSCIKVLRGIKGNYSISPLLNVKLLTIECRSMELSDIVGLLRSFPNLKMLVVNWKSGLEKFKFDAENYAESEANILKSNLLQMRTVVINWYKYKASFFGFIEFLLEHAAMIEKMVIRKQGEVNLKEMFEAEKKLMSLKRSFPSVELILC